MSIKNPKRKIGSWAVAPVVLSSKAKSNKVDNKIHPLPPQTTSQPSLMSSLKESIVSGVGAGIGLNIGDRIVSSIFGNRTVNVVHKSPECDDINKIYKEMSESGNVTESVKAAFDKCSNQK
jgi:hypothetical protein